MNSCDTYCCLEINSTFLLLSECYIWWFLVEPNNRMNTFSHAHSTQLLKKNNTETRNKISTFPWR